MENSLYKLYSNKQILNDDLNCLQSILNGNKSIQDVDYKTKERLIYLCDMRNTQIQNKIAKVNNEIHKLKQKYSFL